MYQGYGRPHRSLRCLQAGGGTEDKGGASGTTALPLHQRDGFHGLSQSDRGGGGRGGYRLRRPFPGDQPALYGQSGGRPGRNRVLYRPGSGFIKPDQRSFQGGARQVQFARRGSGGSGHRRPELPDPGGDDLQPGLPAGGTASFPPAAPGAGGGTPGQG